MENKMGSAYAKSWEKSMSDLERLYGNGVVYVSDGKMVSEFSCAQLRY